MTPECAIASGLLVAAIWSISVFVSLVTRPLQFAISDYAITTTKRHDNSRIVKCKNRPPSAIRDQENYDPNAREIRMKEYVKHIK